MSPFGKRHAFCFYGVLLNWFECVFGQSITCGEQPLNKSVFYPTHYELAPIKGPGEMEDLVGMTGKSEPTTWSRVHATTGAFSDCSTPLPIFDILLLIEFMSISNAERTEKTWKLSRWKRRRPWRLSHRSVLPCLIFRAYSTPPFHFRFPNVQPRICCNCWCLNPRILVGCIFANVCKPNGIFSRLVSELRFL